VRHPRAAPCHAGSRARLSGTARSSSVRTRRPRSAPSTECCRFSPKTWLFLRAGAPIVYRSRSRAATPRGECAAAGTVLSWQPLGGELYGRPSLATPTAVAARVSKQGEPTLDLARYIAFWKRDGSWARWVDGELPAYSDVSNAPTPSASPTPEISLHGAAAVEARCELTAKLRTTDSASPISRNRMVWRGVQYLRRSRRGDTQPWRNW
jgi:hypothetical protein